MSADEDALYNSANQYILNKLVSFYAISQEQKEVYENAFKADDVQKELADLYTLPQKIVIFGLQTGSGKEKWLVNPKDRKKMGVLVLKTNKEKMLDIDMQKNFTFITLSKKVLEEMYEICKEVFFPILAKTVKEKDKSSELLSKELVENFHSFLSHYYVCLGHTKGETRLPLPSKEINDDTLIQENDKTQICEGAVIMWIDLIKHILKQEPEHEFRNGNNPLPYTEIEFWLKRSNTLKSILSQINESAVKSTLDFLQKQKSTYYQMFIEIKRDVEQNAKESFYNYTYLHVLDKIFSKIGDDQTDITEIVDEFMPMFHIIRKIWEDNEYYAKQERLIVLIRKICNAIIMKGTEFIKGTILTKIMEDPDKEIQNLEETRKIIQELTNAYFTYKDAGESKWNISRNVIFYRLDAFNDRLVDILSIAKSYFEFRKMSEKILGGIKADALQLSLKNIFDECTNAIKVCNAPINDATEFDALDIESDLFNIRYNEFKDNLKELERKISAVLTQSFDENETILGKFKVLENFDTILERPYIAVELEKKYNILLDAYKNELKIVQNLFLKGKELIDANDPKNPLNKNMPPIAAKLNWTYSLKSRITEPLEKFLKCGKRISEKEEFNEIKNNYDSISSMIDSYGSQSKIQWDEKAKVASLEKQKIFILTKSQEGGLINVNFDPELSQLLKEVKYLCILNMPIPDEAKQTFDKNSTFRRQISDLENIKAQYNTIVKSLNEVEKPMVAKKLQKVDLLLKDGFDKLTWEQNDQIDQFTKKALDSIGELSGTVDKLQSFVNKLNGLFGQYSKEEEMLFTRPAGLTEAMGVKTKFSNDFDYKRTMIGNKVKDISSLQEVQNALKSAVNNLSSFKETQEWKNYQHFINSIVLEGSIELIITNLNHLCNSLDPSLPPFCSVKLLLEDRKIFFNPSFNDDGSGNSIKDMIIEWINSYLNLSTLFRVRVDTSSGDYMIEVLEDCRVQEIVYKLYNEIACLSKESNEKLKAFNDFKVIWESDFEESFNEFLKKNTIIPEISEDQKERNERIQKVFNEKNPNPITKDIIEYTPSKEKFDDTINEFKDKLKKVRNMSDSVQVRWIQIDFSEFKSSLSSSIEEWIEKYKDFLRKNSKQKIDNIEKFMKRIQSGILNRPKETKTEEDRKKFYQILEIIRDMELLYPKIMELIPSIKGELTILNKHMKRENEDDPFDIEEKNTDSEENKLLVKTEEIEKSIPILKKDVDSLSENINELIDKEKANFRADKKSFEEELDNFRKEFGEKAPKQLLHFTAQEIKEAYESLDNYLVRTQKLEETMKKNNDKELLLKLPLSKNQQIADCYKDLQYIKSVWDYIELNFDIYENWKKIKISDIDIAEITDLSESLKSNLNNVKKDVRNTVPGFNALQQRTKDINDTMAQIQTLTEGNIIKPRHWKHLQEVIEKRIPYDSSDFSVNHFLELELYKFKEEVDTERAIADGQGKMEKEFKTIEKRWQNEKFIMTNVLNKKTYSFPLFEHLEMDKKIEILETDIAKLSSLVQKKNLLDNFEGMDESLNKELDKLKIVCDVVKQWIKLQKNWEKLEVIFLQSDDIQNKLRNEYNSFKDLDAKFREEMKNAYDYNIMLDVCTEARKQSINEMITSIEECQRALDNYLGTKKKQFPRFYFVSNDTLLGMLAQADYPNLINKNVKDCFDGIKQWGMKELDENGKSNTVYSMYSAANGEVVEFDEPFICEGQLVEIYLGKFEEKMKNTLKDLLYKSYKAVNWNSTQFTEKMKDDKTRHMWLNPFPAQLALLVTQIIWTEEVEHALEATDGGDSGALKEFYELSVKRIEHLIDRVRDEVLTKDLRAKIITVITVDVHGRDVVENFSKMKPAIEPNNFNWKKQLRFYYNADKRECSIKICDYLSYYSYEYIGNTGRLVITPLTDRCYITLTQALNLILGGAPAGPAGTGKTETVKDLGRNMGLGVIVNNCSEQMDIETTERIFSGLSQTGFWGCFDEFNRILIEVLSVVSCQVKAVLDALRNNLKTFTFYGNEINLINTVGFFITMNPGYAGRTELPDNLKALFRSCAMVVPDLKEICQNMLMSEGFSKAKKIASKFITLYKLSRDLLSKQIHYDWGLRAIKSLLRQAGGLKRHEANKDKNEFTIIKTALFDFNKAKIVPDDLIIFERLLADLFKESEQKKGNDDEINAEINKQIDMATECPDVNLQKDASFTVKTRQLKEILEVRHCLFILGAPGSGKTCVWKTLFYTNNNFRGEESKYAELSPKSITGFELFGYVDDKTKVWKYGILSSIMRKMCKNEHPYTENLKNKWIILDGDIDPNWIESLNTVMDDNKVLTLTNGDRFPLDEYMRLIFEVSNLRNATPATVSRGGVLYINENDIGIMPCFDKWIKDRYSSQDMNIVKRLLQEFWKSTFDKVRYWKNEKYISNVVEISLLQNFMVIFQNLMDNLIYNKSKPFAEQDDETKALLTEGIFFFAFMWGVGGGLITRDAMEPVINGSIKSKNKLRLPEKGKCFDYFFDTEKIAWVPWSEKIHQPTIEENDLFSDIIIPNVEVTRLCRIMEINLLEDRPCLFIGGSGTGKTAVVKYFFKNYMGSLQKLKRSPEGDNAITFENCTINFNSFTESSILQGNIDSNIKGRKGTIFGPDPQHKKIFFMDDLNMPQLDQFGTQSHVELLRQVIDYKFYYDRKDLELIRQLEDLLFIGSQNPNAGSFVIDSRLQRHFTLFATTSPSTEMTKEIYTIILTNHFSKFIFKNKEDNKDIIIKNILDKTCQLLHDVKQDPKFSPSASKFHYQWNMREVAKVVGGCLRTSPTFYKEANMIYKLWFHECNRVFRDKLIEAEDMKSYDNLIITGLKEIYQGDTTNLAEEVTEPFIFVPFGPEITDEMPEALIQYKTYDLLKKEIDENLQRYNDEKGDLPLVLFDDAIQDICRIARIISNSSSNALLVGVGGSGKQSLTKLASFMKGIEFATPNLSGSDYDKEAFLNDVKKVMDKAVLKQGTTPYVFLVGDNHIIDEYFLVYINTFLSSYWIEEIFENPKDLEEIISKNLRSTVAEYGFAKTAVEATTENLKEYLYFRVKKNVHFVLCFSPVGETLRGRVRKFPSILSGSSIDWFHDWPEKALIAVSSRFVSSMEQFAENQEETTKIAKISSDIHKSINEFNLAFFESERRYNYTTPKSFLELIKYFQLLVSRKMDEIDKNIDRLERGLETVANASEKVTQLKAEIAVTSEKVKVEQEKTNELLAKLEVENEKISGEKAKVEEAATNAANESAKAEQEKAVANAALQEALPAMQRAEAAAQNIEVDDLVKFKDAKKPSPTNYQVFKLVYLIFNPKDKIPTDDMEKELPNIKNKALSKNAQQIKAQMIKLLEDISWVTPEFLNKVQKYREPPFNDIPAMKKVSGAVGGIAEFFLNLCTYYEKKQIVIPLEAKANEATEIAEKANATKLELEKTFEIVSRKQRELQKQYEDSLEKKKKVEDEQQRLENQLAIAEKFIGLLADSNERWKIDVSRLKECRLNISGDCILCSSFVSYIGVFNSFFRQKVIDKWKEIITINNVKITEGIDIVRTLTNEAELLKMKAEGLPADPFSEENAVIITQCTRYPLIIDPQMQAIGWLKMRSEKKCLVQYKQKGWDQIIGEALGTGDPLIIEDVDQEIDPMLSPIMGKQTTNKDKNAKMANIRVGSNDYQFNTLTPIYFITKISNPHYKPEIIAQCTLINFIVTEKGLEDQLLASVVNIEKPDLEENIRNSVNTLNKLQAELLAKEDDVLQKLSLADPATILENTELINSLENTKNSSIEINKSKKETEDLIKEINEKREIYRGVGQEGSMLFFLIGKLFIINFMYQYSLNSFTYFFEKAISETEKNENQTIRVQKLREKIRYTVYAWVSSGMFECDKKLLLTLIALRLLQRNALTHESLQGVGNKHIQFLLKCPGKGGLDNPFPSILADSNWNSLCYLSELDGLQGFAEKVKSEYQNKFKEWLQELNCEACDLPPDWKKYKIYSFHKILIIRACRKERVGIALNEFIRVCLPEGENFLAPKTFSDNLHRSFMDSKPETPIFFILSPGSNPIADLEILGGQILPQEIKKTFKSGKNFKDIAMGQNAEKLAEEEIRVGNSDGNWVFLQNVHLMPKWLKCLEDKMKEIAKEKGHEDFRLYLSAEPSDKIPVGILEKCIKLTNEPPSGLKENMCIAFNTIKNAPGVSYSDEKRRCGVQFGLCYYHAVLIERKKFGSLGWNRNYPYSLDDLRNSDAIVGKYIEAGVSRIPWEDLKYIVGEIMYGGHIVDDMDRVLNNAYLDYILGDKLFIDLDLVPYPSNSSAMKVNPIKVPMDHPNFAFEQWDKYIAEIITSESPALIGLHPNAEIEYRINESNTLFKNMIDMEPKDSGGGESGGEGNAYTSAREFIDKYMEDFNEGVFDIAKIKNSIEGEIQPNHNVFIQECEYMTILCNLIKKNLRDVSDALKGTLSMDERIEGLIFSLYNQRVPPEWIKKGFASKYGLSDWKKSLEGRIKQLKAFEEGEATVPKVVFINRLFNPLSYLTAIRQISARKQAQELDSLDIQTEPSNYYLNEPCDPNTFQFPENKGIPVYGFHLQGCSYDRETKCLAEAIPKRTYNVLPIIFCRVVQVEFLDPKKELKNYYICPIYKTIDRQSTFVCFAQFKSKEAPPKWTIAGVAVILECVETDGVDLPKFGK